MAREIKFRVATKFCDDPFLGDVLELNLSEGTGTCYIWLHSYGGEEQDFDLNCGDKLMQYTGLTDKNGKEIYEGDVIKYESFYGDIGTEKVSFEDGMFCVSHLALAQLGSIEILGNVFENPELI